MTGVIYARYSSDNQREESIEGQLRECMAFAERSGITIIANYIDRAMSARTADRPDFQHINHPGGHSEGVWFGFVEYCSTTKGSLSSDDGGLLLFLFYEHYKSALIR